MTTLLYLTDAYLNETYATIEKIVPGGLVLDKTVFYPKGGGQESDTGTMIIDEVAYKINSFQKVEEDYVHFIEEHIPEASVGKKVHIKLDWDRRYTMMKYHTALHLLSHVAHSIYSAQTAGNQITQEKARIDFTLKDLTKELVKEIENATNDIISLGLDVVITDTPRDKAIEEVDPEKTRLDLIPSTISSIRLVKIGDVDVDACGGTHVKNTKEIGSIDIFKTINKGKNRKRLELRLK